jgi:H+/Na+-translocating ferredoxin:NAD+ oxidoreductase subunit G
MGAILMVVGLVSAVGLGLTYAVTRKKIEAYDRQLEAKAAVAAIPGVKSISELREDPDLTRRARAVEGVEKVYVSDKGYIFKVNTKGYGGPLVLAIGVSPEGEVVGVSTISSKETMGLGSKVLEEDNLAKYRGKTGDDPIEVGKDVQAVTGATITSKAVAGQVKKALQAYRAIR